MINLVMLMLLFLPMVLLTVAVSCLAYVIWKISPEVRRIAVVAGEGPLGEVFQPKTSVTVKKTWDDDREAVG